MIDVQNLQKYFGETRAVDAVSFSVKQGELCGLLGPNGAGKSTIFKMLMGLIKPDTGVFRIAGEMISYSETSYKSKIGYAPENPVFYEYLTGMQFLQFVTAAKAIPYKKRQADIDHWMAFFDLTAKTDELVNNYSQGMRRKLSLSAALLGEPKILILDEATNGLDPESSFKIKKYFREFCSNGGTILFSTHIIEIVEHLCDRIIVLHKGEKLKELQRTDWEGLRKSGSSLEQEFIHLVQKAV
ncbi:MAG: ABC transporter ATP-binding protein [bacterium]